MRGLRPRRPLADARACALTLQSVSLLLAYPGDTLATTVALVRDARDRLPAPAAAALDPLCEHLWSTPLAELQRNYVETFDLRRRCSPYLTYFSHGDTRKRGMALLRFTHAYRSAGAAFVADELPDHLAVVCEFAATVDLELGLRLLAENRAAVELLRSALADGASPYVGALDAVRSVLPDAAPRDLQRAAELARTGPPEEEVGLEPFGPPELMGPGVGARR